MVVGGKWHNVWFCSIVLYNVNFGSFYVRFIQSEPSVCQSRTICSWNMWRRQMSMESLIWVKCIRCDCRMVSLQAIALAYSSHFQNMFDRQSSEQPDASISHAFAYLIKCSTIISIRIAFLRVCVFIHRSNRKCHKALKIGPIYVLFFEALFFSHFFCCHFVE